MATDRDGFTYSYEMQQELVVRAYEGTTRAVDNVSRAYAYDTTRGGDGKEYEELLETLRQAQAAVLAFMDALRPMVEAEKEAEKARRTK